MKSDPKFNDPLKAKRIDPKENPKDGANSPWDFRAPCYDQRSGPWVNAGTSYGVGHKQPVGHDGNPKERAPTLPMGRHSTLDSDEVA